MASRPAAQAPSGSSATTAATPIPHSPGGSQDAKVSSSSLSSSSGTSAASPGPWRPSFARQQSNSTLSSPSASTPTTSRSNSLLRHHSTRNSSSSSSSTSSTSGGGSGVATGSGSSSHHHPMESPSLSAALSKDTGYFSHPGSSSPRLSSPSIYNKPSSPGPGSGSGGASGGNFSSSMPTSQTMNLESLAAKFADSKEIKEKFAKLQLSPALSPGGFLDKDRRGANPSSSSSAGSSVLPPNKSHHHHPRSTPSGHSSPSIPSSSSFGQSSPMHSPLLRQQSLGHVGSSALSSSSSSTSPQKPTAPSPSLLSTTAAVGTATGATSANLATPSSPAALNGSNGLKSPLSQSTDMRRTASHNSAFATGLGAPISIHQSNGSSPSLAPFSLGSIAPTPRRSSLHPDDPAAPTALAAKYKDQHPLQHSWTLYFDVSMGFGRQGSSLHHFESGLKELGIFQSVESFARYFNWIPKPHKMDNSTNYHLFKDGIKPMWEDPANAKGGRWIVTLLSKNPELLDKYWLELAYALVGEQLDEDDDICGAVLSRRTKADRLAVWVRDRDNITAINGIGKRLIKLLDFGRERMSLEFQITGDVATTPIATPKRYITLDTIRRDLEIEQQENIAKARRESLDASAANTEDSQVAAEGSVAGVASGEESSNSKARKNSYDETVAAVAGSSGGGGLLISMESAPTKNTPIVSVTRTEIEA
ncbi:hypothetical protein DFQ26_005364 [Actinomortierella ambigua]|nr:hypothetical protein DFQ26_005364 [Actinomortierella ambigua]